MDTAKGKEVTVSERIDYDDQTSVANIKWEFDSQCGSVMCYEFNIFVHYPESLINIINDSGYAIKNIYGGYDMRPFNTESNLQIYEIAI